MSTLAISEIFGPTIQGEGDLIGTPCVFIRTGGCDFRCQWCDTPHAVLSKYARDWRKMSAQEIIEQVRTLAQPPCLITLSGGNPALQPCEPLIQLGKEQGYCFALETQGSVARPWFALLDALTLSPKPPSAQVPFCQNTLDTCLVYATQGVRVTIKCVVANEQDYDWAKTLSTHYPDVPFFLQPVALAGETLTERIARLDWLIEHTLKDTWHTVRVLPQLHTLLWGDARGV